MGEIYIIAVDPDQQRWGIASALMDHAMLQMRRAGMAIAMVETGDVRPRQVALGLALDDLDQPTDVGRADVHPHEVARPAPGGLLAHLLPARESVDQTPVARQVGDALPHLPGGGGERDLLLDPHCGYPSTGRRRSAASPSRASCILPVTAA